MAVTEILRGLAKINISETKAQLGITISDGHKSYDSYPLTATIGLTRIDDIGIDPTGSIDVYINNTFSHSITVSGFTLGTGSSFSVGPDAGNYHISAQYSGDTNYQSAEAENVFVITSVSSPDNPVTPPVGPTPTGPS